MTPNYWVVIPAAGSGTRMDAEIPKQYLKVRGKCILDHVLERFCLHPKIDGIVVALADGDQYWSNLEYATNSKVMHTGGGTERHNSVLNGIRFLSDYAQPHDWVLVHDAARPCIRAEDIDLLIKELDGHPVGGLLALPVSDTMKRASQDNLVLETVNRDDLWHALTPQMFQLETLTGALSTAISNDLIVTDEAQAIESIGLRPRLVQGHPDNIKVTHKDDLALAELFLSQREINK